MECSTNANTENLFEVFLLPQGQGSAAVLVLRQVRNYVRIVRVRPFNDVGIGPVLERLAIDQGLHLAAPDAADHGDADVGFAEQARMGAGRKAAAAIDTYLKSKRK